MLRFNIKNEHVSMSVTKASVVKTSVDYANLRVGEVTLLASNWQGDKSPYSQIVSIGGITKYSQVDLTPSVEQLVAFHDKDLALVAENDNGVVTVYAIGQKPMNDYVMQVTIKEVIV
jgi:hypothetical protein